MHTVRFSREQSKLLFCPDLDKLPDTTRFNKPAGIKKLLADGWAEPYTRDSYETVLEKIRERISALQDPGNLDAQLGLGL